MIKISRSLLILFHPFKNKIRDIYEQNVTGIFECNRNEIDLKQGLFEKHKVMTDIINSMQK